MRALIFWLTDDRLYGAILRSFEQAHCARMRLCMSDELCSAFFEYPPKWCTYSAGVAGAARVVVACTDRSVCRSVGCQVLRPPHPHSSRGAWPSSLLTPPPSQPPTPLSHPNLLSHVYLTPVTLSRAASVCAQLSTDWPVRVLDALVHLGDDGLDGAALQLPPHAPSGPAPALRPLPGLQARQQHHVHQLQQHHRQHQHHDQAAQSEALQTPEPEHRGEGGRGWGRVAGVGEGGWGGVGRSPGHECVGRGEEGLAWRDPRLMSPRPRRLRVASWSEGLGRSRSGSVPKL